MLSFNLFVKVSEVAVGGERFRRVFSGQYRQWWFCITWTIMENLRKQNIHLLEYNLGILQNVISRTVQNTTSWEESEGHVNTVCM